MVSCKRTIVASSGYMLIHPLMVQRWFRRVTVFAEGEAREEWQERRDEIGGIDEASVAGFPLDASIRKSDFARPAGGTGDGGGERKKRIGSNKTGGKHAGRKIVRVAGI
ncbi:hypothetical protein V1477_004754 [Vespula maculifrons]|uniref:Uncharacterized protein n=3 Tax=Vespula TaxID=7451 RepID=A0A834NMG0_VESGE|nr:hypothetical protein HZH68_002494 [Vespula germanica]KAF7434802.1 hypothetical protein H0235_002993 [Vespula pensylvanica]